MTRVERYGAGGSGDPVALEERWDPGQIGQLRELYAPLRRFAAVVGRSDVGPDDVVQSAFAKVPARPCGEIRNLGPYLRQTVVNLATDERRRSARANVARRRIGPAAATSDACPSDLEDLLRVQPRVRALLYLVEIERRPIADAAEVVGMSNSSARVALMRARRRLRSELTLEAEGE